MALSHNSRFIYVREGGNGTVGGFRAQADGSQKFVTSAAWSTIGHRRTIALFWKSSRRCHANKVELHFGECFQSRSPHQLRVVQATKVKRTVPAEIQVIAFDFYGTLVDLTAITRACVGITPNADAFCATWRTKQLEYTFWLSLMNRYRDFDRVTEAALDFTLKHYDVGVDAVQRAALMSAWARPGAYSDVPLALSKLAANYELVVLSNGTARSLADGLAYLGLGRYFRRVLSVDAVKVYKPAPSVYQLVLDQCQVTKAQVLFVSSNSFDVIGAASFGFEVCHVNRRHLPLDPLGIEPNLTVAHLGELTQLLNVGSP